MQPLFIGNLDGHCRTEPICLTSHLGKLFRS
jgi:hypothetical protein